MTKDNDTTLSSIKIRKKQPGRMINYVDYTDEGNIDIIKVIKCLFVFIVFVAMVTVIVFTLINHCIPCYVNSGTHKNEIINKTTFYV